MVKITFMGAGSTIFARNVLGDCMCTPCLQDAEMALYDIDAVRLEESHTILEGINQNINESRAKIKVYLGEENRKEALRGADFVVFAVRVGGYDHGLIDFEIPKKYNYRQTIADTLGIGGLMRGLRTVPVVEEFARDMEEVCPDALLLNYVNPMAIVTGYLQRYTRIKTVGLCHSVQVCSQRVLEKLGMEDRLEGRKDLIFGINHMAWLLDVRDKDGNDLYPEIKERAKKKNAEEKHDDMVRFDYIDKLGYYCTESSEHNAEYNPFYIKSRYPELIDRFQIPLDASPERCRKIVEGWEEEKEKILNGGKITHERSNEYASRIMEAVVTGKPDKIAGNVINEGLIDNLVPDACVEVPCLVDGEGIHPCHMGRLPVHLAGMNMTNINMQLMAIEAAKSRNIEDIYRAAMLDPHTAAELSIDDIRSLCDELIEAHGELMSMYHK